MTTTTYENSYLEKSDFPEKRGESELPDDAATDMIFAKRGCCFWIPGFGSSAGAGSGTGSWERIRTNEMNERWWMRGWKALKEWSEVVAGPRWKTFIRRFNKKVRDGKNAKFQYDPLSYARNFDEGYGLDGNSDEYRYGTFSVRYASVPSSTKSSMDFGKDAPDFTTGGGGSGSGSGGGH